MTTRKIHLGGKKYLVEEHYQVGGAGKRGRKRKETQMKIYKLVTPGGERFLARDEYRKLMHKYRELVYDKKKDDRSKKYLKRNLENNMMDLVPPHQVNPAQRRLLQHILGVKNVSEIEMFNTLVHAGLINTTCPPLNEPDKSETYIDPVTGRKQCRYPTLYRKEVHNTDLTCPDITNGDPFATERYVDWRGAVTCRRPVIRGAFFCPQPGAPDKTRSVTMADGTGICLPEDTAANAPSLFPTQVMYPDGVNHKIVMFETVFNNVNMSPKLVERLNTLFSKSTCLKDLRDRVEQDASLGWLKGVVSKLRSNKDIKICNAALWRYIKKNMPHYLDNRYPSSTDAFIKFFGVQNGEHLVMGGGRRRKSRNSSKRNSSKRKPAKRKPAKRKPAKRKPAKKKPAKKRSAKRKPAKKKSTKKKPAKRKPAKKKPVKKKAKRKPTRKKVTGRSSSSAKSSF